MTYALMRKIPKIKFKISAREREILSGFNFFYSPPLLYLWQHICYDFKQ